jgi:hypothetical protein
MPENRLSYPLLKNDIRVVLPRKYRESEPDFPWKV